MHLIFLWSLENELEMTWRGDVLFTLVAGLLLAALLLPIIVTAVVSFSVRDFFFRRTD